MEPVNTEQTSESNLKSRKTNGFLKLVRKSMKIRKKKKTDAGELVQQRKIVKAVHPITPVKQDTIVDEEVREEPDDTPETHLPVTKLPLVQQQLDVDHAEKWRQQRLEVSAAFRKEIKEKEIHDHRFKVSEPSNIQSPKAVDFDKNSLAMPIAHGSNIPSILSVESQYPEHKRTVQERGTEVETSVKRSKLMIESKSPIVTMKKEGSSIRKYCIPVAVAVAAICLMKFLRR